MAKLGIVEEDLDEQFIVGHGKGGQKLQKTASCVRLSHEALELSVRVSDIRIRSDNRYFARVRLCDQYEEKVLGAKSKEKQQQEKIRRQKKRRSRKAKEKMLKNKAHQSQKKAQRKKPDES